MSPSTHEIERDIERTRSEMDETLDQFRDRMQPRHLLDDAFGMLGISSDGEGNVQARETAQRVGKHVLDAIKQHPMPALLCAAGVVWLAVEMQRSNEDEPDYDRLRYFPDEDRRSRRRRARPQAWQGEGLYDDDDRFEPMPGHPAAWHEAYDWSEEDESAWTEQAKSAMQSLQQTLADTGKSAGEKMKQAAEHVRGLSGKKYQSKWRDWKERAGSVVDARTGEPYDDTYGHEWGDQWREAEGADYLATAQGDESWDRHASSTLEKLQAALADTGSSVRRRVGAIASHVGDFAGTVRGGGKSAMRGAGRYGGRAVRYGRQAGERSARAVYSAGEQTMHAAQRVGQGTSHVAYQAAGQAQQGYEYASLTVRHTANEYPLAAGAACLGLGLLVGLLVPETAQENRLMGEASDKLKRQAKEAGKDALHRAQHVAQETANVAMEEAERQGLTPHQLADQARQTASRVAEAAKTSGSEGETLLDKAGHVLARAAETAKDEAKQELRSTTAKSGTSGASTI